MNQQLGCLKVGLLPSRHGFESRSEQDFGLCWVEVFCETKSIELIIGHKKGFIMCFKGEKCLKNNCSITKHYKNLR